MHVACNAVKSALFVDLRSCRDGKAAGARSTIARTEMWKQQLRYFFITRKTKISRHQQNTCNGMKETNTIKRFVHVHLHMHDVMGHGQGMVMTWSWWNGTSSLSPKYLFVPTGSLPLSESSNNITTIGSAHSCLYGNHKPQLTIWYVFRTHGHYR